MNKHVLIVEDEFIVANDLQIILQKAGYTVSGIAASVDEAARLIQQRRPDLVLLDIQLKGEKTGIDLARQLKQENIAFVYLSANSNQSILEEAKATEPYGFLVKPFRPKDILITLDIARYRHEHSQETSLRREVMLQQLFLAINNETSEWEEKLLKIAIAIQPHVPFDCMMTSMRASEHQIKGCSFLRIGFEQYQMIREEELSVITGLSSKELKKLESAVPPEKTAALYNDEDFKKACTKNPVKALFAKTFNLESLLVMPLFLLSGKIFALHFFSRKPDAYAPAHLELLRRLQQSLSIVIENILIREEMTAFSGISQHQKKVNLPETEIISNFEGIIGSSPPLLNALDLLSQVAPLDTSVLILGESGTGKEKMASCIHMLSPRKDGPFVKINCATLPPTLIESELFGHEKGAFTGAIEKRTGKFEQAHDGTIFLDEIGEMPPELQVKLLRVLQEKQVERIGGKGPVKVNVRIIAATNRNLEKEVAEGRFRLDLYYRLNVFPIVSPALRERGEDIKQLANYFAIQGSNRIGKSFPGISAQMMNELEAWHWPGNIRELENIIEQSIILNDGKSELTLRRPLQPLPTENYTAPARSLIDVKQKQLQDEKAYIFSILKKTNGRIRGKGGAAELLNLKPTTLESRMAKLGIRKEDLV